eukprot:CAMPEP_0170470474 /NCGR_PEP_ID=MMETSP0123-20130129/12924_1 /TAXON_ID=182087 /ORGANISM="Favella ehrenbergii, Strain Fehren 1" /LENGTH=128 /DNA_ID=CAMNT_0010737619 /DNA_START=931 /DNA_END=1318 /DNA_ORIENTATION=-
MTGVKRNPAEEWSCQQGIRVGDPFWELGQALAKESFADQLSNFTFVVASDDDRTLDIDNEAILAGGRRPADHRGEGRWSNVLVGNLHLVASLLGISLVRVVAVHSGVMVNSVALLDVAGHVDLLKSDA